MSSTAYPTTSILAGVARLPFLLLTPASLTIAFALAYCDQGAIDPLRTVLIVITALAAHVAVNAFNEYSDFKHGIDQQTQRTPFSGGSGTLPAYPQADFLAFGLGVVATLITLAGGVTLLWFCGWQLLPLGLPGIVLMLTYSPWLHRSPLACLLAPGIAFGPVMNIGAYFALTGTITSGIVLASLLPCALASNLLLLNQLPDIDADRAGGRRHIPIVLGWQGALQVYLLVALTGYATLVVAVVMHQLPASALFAAIPATVAIAIYRRASRASFDPEKLLPALRDNVLLALLNPLLLALVLLISTC